mmetsp:Transcript_19084/g.48514  ORF Transcript_19084/g.48514 Transcript_19084/m.48514 type:complete len:348 (-) Transcript_19084:13-1056(-)
MATPRRSASAMRSFSRRFSSSISRLSSSIVLSRSASNCRSLSSSLSTSRLFSPSILACRSAMVASRSASCRSASARASRICARRFSTSRSASSYAISSSTMRLFITSSSLCFSIIAIFKRSSSSACAFSNRSISSSLPFNAVAWSFSTASSRAWMPLSVVHSWSSFSLPSCSSPRSLSTSFRSSSIGDPPLDACVRRFSFRGLTDGDDLVLWCRLSFPFEDVRTIPGGCAAASPASMAPLGAFCFNICSHFSSFDVMGMKFLLSKSCCRCSSTDAFRRSMACCVADNAMLKRWASSPAFPHDGCNFSASTMHCAPAARVLVIELMLFTLLSSPGCASLVCRVNRCVF